MDFANPKPIYQQIADYMLAQIISGHWLPDDRIKSVRDLAAEIEVNPNTAMRAYNLLSEQGIIYQKRGIGYFLHSDAHLKATQYERQHFIREQLPIIFEKLDLLDMSIAEVVDQYNLFKKEKK